METNRPLKIHMLNLNPKSWRFGSDDLSFQVIFSNIFHEKFLAWFGPQVSLDSKKVPPHGVLHQTRRGPEKVDFWVATPSKTPKTTNWIHHTPLTMLSTNGEAGWVVGGLGFWGLPLCNNLFHKEIPGIQTTNPNHQISDSCSLPSRKLTYPTFGKGKSSSRLDFSGMLVSKQKKKTTLYK